MYLQSGGCLPSSSAVLCSWVKVVRFRYWTLLGFWSLSHTVSNTFLWLISSWGAKAAHTHVCLFITELWVGSFVYFLFIFSCSMAFPGYLPCSVLMCVLISIQIGPWSMWIFLKILLIDDTLQSTVYKKGIIRRWDVVSFRRTALHFSVTYTGNFGGLAQPRSREQLSNFPGKNGRIFLFAFDDCGDDTRGEKPRSAPSNSLWFQESSAAVAVQDLTDAPVGHLKYTASANISSAVFRMTWQWANFSRPKSPLAFKLRCSFLRNFELT